VTDPLRVEAPDADLARALVERLRRFRTEVERVNGHVEVLVTLEGHPEQAMTDVLTDVDEWLAENGLLETRIRLADRSYTLTPPVLPSVAVAGGNAAATNGAPAAAAAARTPTPTPYG